jgi:hypothetical protein
MFRFINKIRRRLISKRDESSIFILFFTIPRLIGDIPYRAVLPQIRLMMGFRELNYQ